MNKFIIVSSLLIASCNYTALHDPMMSGVPMGSDAGECVPGEVLPGSISFAQLNQEVLTPKCLGCHSSQFSAGGVNLDNYASAKVHASRIQFTVENDLMPRGPQGPLPPEEKEKIFLWVTSGAPENVFAVSDCEETTPVPPEEVVVETGPLKDMPSDSEINFTLIRERVFSVHCLSCHSPAAGPVAGLNLENYSVVKREIEDIVEEIEDSTMPPFPRPALSSLERNVIQRWIQLGSPE